MKADIRAVTLAYDYLGFIGMMTVMSSFEQYLVV